MDETAKKTRPHRTGCPRRTTGVASGLSYRLAAGSLRRRRDFTKFLVLTSLPFALVQVGLGLLNGFRRHEQPPVKAIAALADIPVGGGARLPLSPGARSLFAAASRRGHAAGL